ncbi:MAG TPA: hypothetical protein VFX49_10470 [Chloroflexota bacterium]|nr:hypothetical protein [Chloroflexota bacterium]
MSVPTYTADTVVLRAGDGTEAHVIPSVGAVCAVCRTPTEAGWAQLLAPVVSIEALRERPTSVGGFPVLFPHPGRHRVPLRWRGREIRPPAVSGDGLVGHGYAAGSAWTVTARSEESVTCRLESRDIPGAEERWPWAAALTATYRVGPRALAFELEIESQAEEPAPSMPGLHPYFPLRLLEGDGSSAEDERRTCWVWVDAPEIWMAAPGAPTGEFIPVSGSTDIREPRSIEEIEGSYGGKMPVLLYTRRATGNAKSGVTSGVWDRAAGLAVVFETSADFGTVALYRPPDPRRVSLEPRAALPDALYVAATQPEIPTGLRTLAPGERYRVSARLTLAPKQS